MLRTFTQVAAAIIVLLSAIFLVRGIAFLSPQDLAELSKTKWNFDLNVARNLVRQHSDAKVGFILLFSSFLLQMINLLWPMRIGDFAVHRMGVILAIVASVLIYVGSCIASEIMSKITYKQVEKIIMQK